MYNSLLIKTAIHNLLSNIHRKTLLNQFCKDVAKIFKFRVSTGLQELNKTNVRLYSTQTLSNQNLEERSSITSAQW